MRGLRVTGRCNRSREQSHLYVHWEDVDSTLPAGSTKKKKFAGFLEIHGTKLYTFIMPKGDFTRSVKRPVSKGLRHKNLLMTHAINSLCSHGASLTLVGKIYLKNYMPFNVFATKFLLIIP